MSHHPSSFPDAYAYSKTALCRSEFRKYVGVDKKDFGAIEYLLRKGQRQLETYRDPGIRNIYG